MRKIDDALRGLVRAEVARAISEQPLPPHAQKPAPKRPTCAVCGRDVGPDGLVVDASRADATDGKITYWTETAYACDAICAGAKSAEMNRRMRIGPDRP